MFSRRSPKAALAEYRRKRDFSKTAEPSGAEAGNAPSPASLRFVIQKHAASHLHFDFRLELDGVMKSWAVPKGPSLDPAVKRLAMEVEDHPISYNTFEGTIPKGEYGGGTVMLWDRGVYSANDQSAGGDSEALRRGYAKGKLDFTLHGERLRGSWALVRTRRDSSGKAQWLLMKQRDEFARDGSDVVGDEVTSVESGRTMEEIAGGKSRVWHSNRAARSKAGAASKQTPQPDSSVKAARGALKKRATKGVARRATKRVMASPSQLPAAIEPMYATIGGAIPTGPDWTFEPKWDGIRVLAFATPQVVQLITRNGKDKAKQFPEVVGALKALAKKARRPLVLDGEIVALRDGEPARFQQLQGRMHVTGEKTIAGHSEQTPASLIVFDILADGDTVLFHEPWTERRRRLETRLRGFSSPGVRLGETASGSGERMLEEARRKGWEGIIAKRTDAAYRPGHRSPDWLKLKIEHRQEFVIGGYTEPRNTREHIGALLLGYFDGDRFVYVGHTGGGFTREGLRAMHRRLKPLERQRSPFVTPPRTNERAHWVTPKVVVEVKFSEWTEDGKLRQPIYLGTRDDKDAREVGREAESVQKGAVRRRPVGRSAAARSTSPRKAVTKRATPRARPPRAVTPPKIAGGNDAVVAQLREIEDKGGDGTVTLGRGGHLEVSNLDKVYFPDDRYSKGDVMRYYAAVAPFILPAIADRPLVLKRYPSGITGKFFFQQNAPDDAPESVRVEMVEREQAEQAPRLAGGDLATLLYTVQLGAIAVDPWHGRVGSLDFADYTILDLDPGPRATFARIVDVARWVREELDALDLHAAIKTSGSRGLHIYVPLPPRTPDDAALLVAQIVATRVADRHPKEATIERAVKARAATAVYVDYMQNVRGKSVSAAYCVRAKKGAPVSTPLKWEELDPSLDPLDFTIATIPDRLARVGDLWNPPMRQKNSLEQVLNGTKGRKGSRR